MINKTTPKLQSPEVVVVEASAGSGKTYTLAKRYLQLLINPYVKLAQIPLPNILAITFTNKATIEMKERILELLKRIALDTFDDKKQEKEIFNLLGVNKKFAQAKAHLIMDELIAHYNFFQVQTIDSFINALLLGCALNIDRSASFRIKRDYSQYLSYSLDRVIDEAATDKEIFSFLEEFLEHYLFVENRSSWFPKKDILELMQSFFTLSNQYGGIFEVYQGQSKDVLKKKAILFSALKKLSAHLPLGLNGTTENDISRFIATGAKTFELKSFPDKFKTPDVPMNRGKVAPSPFLKKWRRVHKTMQELVELDATVVYNPYVKLFQKMLNFLDSLTRREDLLFLEELNHKARFLFASGGLTVAEVYYRFATRFAHYLIDEFQDTSVLQWRNLEMMIEEALSSGGSLFYVGDKKQAIYRFRGGRAQLFDEVMEKFNHYNVKLQFLRKNWRSQKTIVEFNNEVFSQKNLRDALLRMNIQKEIGTDRIAVEGILKVFEDSQQEYEPGNSYGYVKVERIDEKNQEERDCLVRKRLIPLIKKLDRRFSYKDIAILCRDNDEVELVTSWLLEAQIPVESEKTLNIEENPLIKEIVCFLRFLNSPIDDLNFAAFILGDIFRGATALTIKDITDFLFDLNKEKEIDISLYHRFRTKYPQIWNQYIEKFFKSVGFVSPYELVISIYECFGVMENFRSSQAFFMKFLEVIKSQEDEYVGLGDFLIYLENAQKEDLYVKVEMSDSIHILTIHKSKGLEFGVVIVPFLRMDITPPTGGKRMSSYITKSNHQRLGLVRVTNTHRKYSPRLNEIYKDAYFRACIDELNNIYVALTRPKYELYIFIPRKSGISFNKARCLIPQEFKARGEKRRYQSQKVKKERSILKISPSHYADWIKFLKDELVEASTIRNREKIMQGNLMHFVLSQIGNLQKQFKDKAIKEAIENTKNKYPFIDNFVPLEEKAKGLIDLRRMKPFFYISDGEVYQEKEVVNNFGETKRIDRLIVKEKEVWVIDYKSSPGYEEQYKQQVIGYIKIIRELYPHHTIKGFIIYLDELRVEEIDRC